MSEINKEMEEGNMMTYTNRAADIPKLTTARMLHQQELKHRLTSQHTTHNTTKGTKDTCVPLHPIALHTRNGLAALRRGCVTRSSGIVSHANTQHTT